MHTTARSWPPFVLMALVVLVALMSSATPSPLYVDYQETWGTSGTMITTVYAVYALAVLVPLLFLGRLSDAIGRRPVIISGLVLLTVSMVLLAAAPSVAWLIAGRVVQGLGVGLVTGSAAAAIIELHPTRNARAGALINSSTTNFGIAAGVLLAGVVATSSSSPLVHPYVVIGVATAALLTGVVVLVPETSGAGQETFRDAVRLQRIAVPAAARPAFALAAVCVIVSWSVGGVFLGLGGAIAKDLVGRSDYLVTGLVVACLQAAAGLAQLAWNLRAGPSQWRRGMAAGIVTLIVGVAAASATLEAGTVPGFVVAAAVTGLGMGLLFLMGTTLVAQHAPAGARGETFSALFVVAYISLGVPAVVAALLAEVVGLTTAFHLLALVVSVVAGGGLVAVARFGSRPDADA
ncbi:MFS transporter [Rhodococcus sp. IEGM 1408]|uniref:MFS transporter n=1 Tax=Rhodococcus sp. IEGM 1408 TaxID=3082220 RepID=UPI0029530D6D|nr:MFS transporter [Rhodococcus sp. IEGM 1408]MDV8000115.1 MFS transporter [Rhodococcus sp. IEGM 1408]